MEYCWNIVPLYTCNMKLTKFHKNAKHIVYVVKIYNDSCFILKPDKQNYGCSFTSITPFSMSVSCVVFHWYN